MSNENEKRLQTTHPEYQAHQGDWQMCRDFVKGIKALRAHDLSAWKDGLASVIRTGNKSTREPASGSGFVDKVVSCYIPPLSPRMTYVEYVLHLVKGHYYNVVQLTKSGYLGKIFGKEPVITYPVGAAVLSEDTDLEETPLEEYLEDIVDQMLEVGRVGVLVDRPSLATQKTVGESEREGIRPYCATYRAEDILDWATSRIGPRKVTSYVKLRERVMRGSTLDYNYRELKLEASGYFQIEWTRLDTKQDYQFKRIDPRIGGVEDGKPLSSIPFYPFSPRGGGLAVEAPPLLALVDMALEHYQASVEYANARFSTAIPTPGFYGFSEEEVQDITLGGLNAIWSTKADAHSEYLEHQGSGLEPLRNAIKDIEERESKLGTRMLTQDKAAAEAADTLRIRAAGESATLKDIACSASRIASQMMTMAAEWNNTPGAFVIELNTEYADTAMDAQEITALGGLTGKNQFTQHDLNERLRKTGIIDGDRTDEMILAELEAQRNASSSAQELSLSRISAAAKAASAGAGA